MNEQSKSEQGQETKSYKSSIEEVANYLEERIKEMHRRRSEGKEPTLEEVVTNFGDLFEGLDFLKSKGPSLKSIGKETVGSVLKNPRSWEDLLTQGVVRAQQTVATHMSERTEKKTGN